MRNGRVVRSIVSAGVVLVAALGLFVLAPLTVDRPEAAEPFDVMEATIEGIQAAYNAKQLTSHQLVQLYLDRIEAYDKSGPAINAIITVNPKALEEADKLDQAFKTSGPVGPLHGIPVLIKDQIDTKGMPTTLGSVLLKDYYPQDDAFVVAKLRQAGAVILGKTTLGEFGGGDAYGSLFGATRNPYALDRTSGGSSGGNGASLAANFATVAVGEEIQLVDPATVDLEFHRGHAADAGLISRTGMYDGWPSINGSLGPMARTVADLATLLDVMVGYDPADPLTAAGVGKAPPTFTKFLDKNGLKGARLGVPREPLGSSSEPDSADFKKVTAVFDEALAELKAAGATLIDPVVIPDLKTLLGKRANGLDSDQAVAQYFKQPNAPFRSRADMLAAAEAQNLGDFTKRRLRGQPDQERWHEYLAARQQLTISFQKVLADHNLDAFVHKGVEHTPTLISQGMNPPYVSSKGSITIATFLVFVSAVTVPAGFTTDHLPVGITFLGREYTDPAMIKFAYAYEQATHHRRPPTSIPGLE